MEELLITLTKMFGIRPIYYEDFNKVFVIKDINKLRALEEEHPQLGIYGYETIKEGVSVVSIINTITRFLTGDTMAFNIVKVKDRWGKTRQLIKGVCLYEEELSDKLQALTDKNVINLIHEYDLTICGDSCKDDIVPMTDIDIGG